MSRTVHRAEIKCHEKLFDANEFQSLLDSLSPFSNESVFSIFLDDIERELESGDPNPKERKNLIILKNLAQKQGYVDISII